MYVAITSKRYLKKEVLMKELLGHVKQKTLPCDCEFVLGILFSTIEEDLGRIRRVSKILKTFLAFI
jgi:hypothetical protein